MVLWRCQPGWWQVCIASFIGLVCSLSSPAQPMMSQGVFGASTTVIDRTMINTYQFLTIADAVQFAAGITIGRSYLKNNIPSVRGIQQGHINNRVLVLLNDIPLRHAVTGHSSLERVNIHEVERIEIERGPSSVIYGNNGYAAVVSIWLRNDQQEHGMFFTHLGKKVYDLGLNAEHVDSSGVNVFGSISSSGNRATVRNFVDELGQSGALREYYSASAVTLAMDAGDHALFANYGTLGEHIYGAAPQYQLGLGGHHTSQGILLHYAWQTETASGIHLTADMTYDYSNNAFLESEFAGERWQVAFQADMPMSHNLTALVGIDNELRRVSSYRSFDVADDIAKQSNSLSRDYHNVPSLFGTITYGKEPLNFAMGARMTVPQDAEPVAALEAGLQYALMPQAALSLSWKQGYRLPNFEEMFLVDSSGNQRGLHTVKPEKSATLELAYRHRIGDIALSTVVYHTNYDRLITRVIDSGDVYHFANTTAFNTTGVEAELRYHYKGYTGFVAYAFHHTGSIATSPGAELPYETPSQVVSAGVAQTSGFLLSSLLMRYINSRRGPLDVVEGRMVIDATIGIVHSAHPLTLRHTLAVKNLFNADVVEPEYIRGRINTLPAGYEQAVRYMLQVSL